MEYITTTLSNLLQQTAFLNLTGGNLIMIAVACVFLYLAIKKGFEEFNKGKTSGSRVKFCRASDQRIILLHKPHPGDEMSIGAIKDLAIRLEEMGEL